MKKKIISLGIIFGVAPVFAFAADTFSVFSTTNQIVSTITTILMSLAIVYFIWGVISYITASDEETRKKSRANIINGLIGLFVIVAFWGIIRLITNTFGVGPQRVNNSSIPCVQGPSDAWSC